MMKECTKPEGRRMAKVNAKGKQHSGNQALDMTNEDWQVAEGATASYNPSHDTRETDNVDLRTHLET